MFEIISLQPEKPIAEALRKSIKELFAWNLPAEN